MRKRCAASTSLTRPQTEARHRPRRMVSGLGAVEDLVSFAYSKMLSCVAFQTFDSKTISSAPTIETALHIQTHKF